MPPKTFIKKTIKINNDFIFITKIYDPKKTMENIEIFGMDSVHSIFAPEIGFPLKKGLYNIRLYHDDNYEIFKILLVHEDCLISELKYKSHASITGNTCLITTEPSLETLNDFFIGIKNSSEKYFCNQNCIGFYTKFDNNKNSSNIKIAKDELGDIVSLFVIFN